MLVKPTICCDLDEVVFDWLGDFLPFMKYKVYQESGINPQGGKEKWTTWDGYRHFGVSDADFRHYYNEFCDRGRFAKSELIDPTFPVYYNEIKQKYDWVFVTARPQKTILHTADCLERNGVYDFILYHVAEHNDEDTKVYFSETHSVLSNAKLTKKKNVYEAYKPEIVIDDHYKFIEDALSVGVQKNILVDQPHNREKWTGQDPAVNIAVSSPCWHDIYGSIKNYSNKNWWRDNQ